VKGSIHYLSKEGIRCIAFSSRLAREAQSLALSTPSIKILAQPQPNMFISSRLTIPHSAAHQLRKVESNIL
jgi:hypothetical protein